MWRGHNHEPVFENRVDRDDYIGFLCQTYTDEVEKHVAWFSYCLMLNHTHEVNELKADTEGGIEAASNTFSYWMRSAHSRFGATFNRRHNRQGKVSYDRPKTKSIDNPKSVLTVMFYGDANPVEAGRVSHPSRYRDSSYRFYAYGESSHRTEKLTPPPAYIALGKTARQRQKKYRRMCDEYLRKKGLLKDRPSKPSKKGPNEEKQSNGRAENGETSDTSESSPSRARGDPLPLAPMKKDT